MIDDKELPCHADGRSRGDTIGVLATFVVCVLVSLVNGCQPTDQSVTPVLTSKLQVSSTMEDCLAKGGRWEAVGLRRHGPGCNPPTVDGGKPCTSKTDCQGACLANPDELGKFVGLGHPLSCSEFVEKADKELIEKAEAQLGVVGVCAPWQYTLDCDFLVNNGRYMLYFSQPPLLP